MGRLYRPDEALTEKDLILPGITPANLRLDGRFKATMVTSDVYNICERLRELNARLFVHYLEDTMTGEGAYCIMELTTEGEKLVFKVRELDARVVEEVRYLLHVPFAERFAASQRLLDKREAEQKEEELDQLYEDLGRQMWYQFEHDGFIEHRGTSYPKRGIKS